MARLKSPQSFRGSGPRGARVAYTGGGDPLGVSVSVEVAVGEGVEVGVRVGVADGLSVEDGMGVTERVAGGEGVEEIVGVAVGVGVPNREPSVRDR